jgi:hypothetical protein
MTAVDRATKKWGMNGSSNSHSEDSYCPVASDNYVERRVGVDTVSWCWRGCEPVDRLLRLDGLVLEGDERPLRVVPAPGRAVRLNRRLNGLGTVGAFPAAPLLFVEGRAAALRARDESDHGLGSVRHLAGTQARVVEDLSALLGAELDSLGELRRIDLSGELAFARGEDGRELLRILDGLHSPRHKTSPVRERGGPGLETAYWRTPARNVPVLRAYDKGVESGSAAPGERIRIERQLRYAGGQRPSLVQFLTRDLGEQYAAPILRWLQNGVVAGTARQLIRLLTDAAVIWPSYWSSGSCWCSSAGRVWQSLWPPRKVERVLGTLAVIDEYGSTWPAWSSKQRQRRLAEIRELGLLLLDRPVYIDADALVSGLCDDWRCAA